MGEVKGEKPLSPFANGETSLAALRRARNPLFYAQNILIYSKLSFHAKQEIMKLKYSSSFAYFSFKKSGRGQGREALVAVLKRRNLSCEILLVVDELCFVAPAVELANLLANLFGRMLSSSLTHRIEVNLAAGVGHIE